LPEPAKEKRAGDEHDRRTDQNRQRAASAEGPIGDAGADVDAAGDSADARGGDVADAEAEQKPVAVAARLARRNHEFGAQESINRSDDGERQRGPENRRHERQEIAAPGNTVEVVEGGKAHGRA
jgi:hypothetical protein